MTSDKSTATTTAPPMCHYVCDRCANQWSAYRLPNDGDGCPACGNAAIWEFTRARAAGEHAAHIQRGLSSGLFKGAA